MQHNRIKWIFALQGLFLLLLTIPCHAATIGLTLFASPQTIKADGQSTSQVTVRINGSVPDGTEALFTTTAGNITPVGHIQGGTATAMLTSSATPTIAVVSVTVWGVSAATQVEFVGTDQDVRIFRNIRFTAKSVYFEADTNRFFANEETYMDFHGMEISADAIQYDQAMQIIKAQGEVHLKQGKKTLDGEEMVYYPTTRQGYLIRIGKTIETLTFQGDSLEATPSHYPIGTEQFTAFKPGISRLGIECTRLVISPGEKMQFTNALIYVKGAPSLKLPYYVVSLTGSTSQFLNQQFRYTSSEGFVLDIPFYFGVTDMDSSAFRLRYASNGSTYSNDYQPRKGFSLALQRDFSFGTRGEGRILLDDIIQDERKLYLTHRQDFANGGQADITLNYQPSSIYAKDIFSGYGSYSQPLGKYSLSLSASQTSGKTLVDSTVNSGQKDEVPYSSPDVRAIVRTPEWRMKSFPLRYSTDVGMGYGRAYLAKSATQSSEEIRTYFNSVGLTLHPNTLNIGKHTTGSSSIRLEHTSFVNGMNGSKVMASTSLQQGFGRSTTLRLGYSYNLQTGNLTGSSYSPSTQVASLDFSSNLGSRFNSGISYSYGFGRNRTMFTTAHAQYQMTDTWRLFLQSNFSQSWYFQEQLPNTTYHYNYMQVGVGKSIGGYEVSLNWSPQGRQAYGLGGNDAKIWIELGADTL